MVPAGMQVKPLFADSPSPCSNQYESRQSEQVARSRQILTCCRGLEAVLVFVFSWLLNQAAGYKSACLVAAPGTGSHRERPARQLLCMHKTTADSPFCSLKVSAIRVLLFPIVSSALFCFALPPVVGS